MKKNFKILIDEYDLKIIKHLDSLNRGEQSSTYILAKKIFPNIVSDYALKLKDTFIRTRLDKLSEYGTIKITKTKNKARYILPDKNCKSIELTTPEGSQKSYELKLNNKWYVFPLP